MKRIARTSNIIITDCFVISESVTKYEMDEQKMLGVVKGFQLAGFKPNTKIKDGIFHVIFVQEIEGGERIHDFFIENGKHYSRVTKRVAII